MARFSLIPAAYVALLRDGMVLLQQRRNTGYMDGHWSFSAAGHVERDESVTAAAAREAHEELGVRVDEADLEPLCTVHRRQSLEMPGQVARFENDLRHAVAHRPAELPHSKARRRRILHGHRPRCPRAACRRARAADTERPARSPHQ